MLSISIALGQTPDYTARLYVCVIVYGAGTLCGKPVSPQLSLVVILSTLEGWPHRVNLGCWCCEQNSNQQM